MENLNLRISPFELQLSFHKYLDELEKIRQNDGDTFRQRNAELILKKVENISGFKNGIYDLNFIHQHENIIRDVLEDLFPLALTDNEIKAANFPFTNGTFNYTRRFRKILDNAGHDFEMKYRSVDEDEFYIFKCCIILYNYFGREIQYILPLYYDIPDADGIIKHYKITVNADFMEVFPKTETVLPTASEVDHLLTNLEDIKLWKSFFPPNSWVMKGFTIITLVDTTTEVALQDLKSNLLKFDIQNFKIDGDFNSLYRSYFNISDLLFGIIPFNEKDQKLQKVGVYEKIMSNHIVDFLTKTNEIFDLNNEEFQHLNFYKHPVVVSDIEQLDNKILQCSAFEMLEKMNIQSFMVLPILSNGKLLAVLEFTSKIKNAFNHMMLKKIDFIVPSILYTIQRFNFERMNQLEAIIQREYTLIQKSVYWKFQLEAEKFFNAKMSKKKYTLGEISFENLVPLFGQTDIQSSSQLRNTGLRMDLCDQIETLKEILSKSKKEKALKYHLKLSEFSKEINTNLKSDTEQRFQTYLIKEIHPYLKNDKALNSTEKLSYFNKIMYGNELFYTERKKLDDSITITNRELAAVIDEEQIKAQEIFPHYFERFNSDGVEHNLYVGSSINPAYDFSPQYISDLRRWQLKTVCLMVQKFQKIRINLPLSIQVTSLIMAYNNEISIRFRMDEKRFDVDGAYNSRYEIIKKRVEKANIKGTGQRLVQSGKICIVYFSEASKNEYLNFLQPLQEEKYITEITEDVEIEDLQGITGLRALRLNLQN